MNYLHRIYNSCIWLHVRVYRHGCQAYLFCKEPEHLGLQGLLVHASPVFMAPVILQTTRLVEGQLYPSVQLCLEGHWSGPAGLVAMCSSLRGKSPLTHHCSPTSIAAGTAESREL